MPPVPDSLSTYEEMRARNARAYNILFEIEVVLREIIARSLAERFGSRWQKQGLPNDIKQKVAEALKYERQTHWTRLTMHHPLYYLDFPDLKKLIANNANWPNGFDQLFTRKTSVEASLSEIELTRNKIAHSRPLTEHDFDLLTSAHHKLIAAVPQDRIADAKRAAAGSTSIRKCLTQLLAALDAALTAASTGASLNTDQVQALQVADEWWLDEMYLGCPLAAFGDFVPLCIAYARIPSGIGQNHVRLKWSKDRQFCELGKAASAEVAAIFALMDKIYA
jgi:hypothetical protein